MDKESEIFYFCDEMRHRLNDIRNDIEFLVSSFTSNPETDFRNKRISVQIDQIASKCFKLHDAACDISKELKQNVKTV